MQGMELAVALLKDMFPAIAQDLHRKHLQWHRRDVRRACQAPALEQKYTIRAPHSQYPPAPSPQLPELEKGHCFPIALRSGNCSQGCETAVFA